jgi:hypothetical protein
VGLAGHNLKLCDRCWELRDIRTQARAAAGNRAWGRADHRAQRRQTWWALILALAAVQLMALAAWLT